MGKLVSNIVNSDFAETKINSKLKSEKLLRDYQITGVVWLKTLARFSMGDILADDMGLGKTIQVLSFIDIEKSVGSTNIVVAPKSLVYNWYLEGKKFTPNLKSIIIIGDKSYRKQAIKNFSNYDLLITSYGSLKNDIDLYKSIDFKYVFIDEAQNIKNPLTLNSNSVKELNAKSCFALTGTPIENRLTELWSIFDFVMPGYLYDLIKIKSLFETPIIKHEKEGKSDELSKMIKPFVLRRLKKEVLNELPEKIKTNSIAHMSEEQKNYM